MTNANVLGIMSLVPLHDIYDSKAPHRCAPVSPRLVRQRGRAFPPRLPGHVDDLHPAGPWRVPVTGCAVRPPGGGMEGRGGAGRVLLGHLSRVYPWRVFFVQLRSRRGDVQDREDREAEA